MLKPIRTIPALIAFIEQHVPKDERSDSSSPRDEAEWFLASHDAGSWYDMTTKDFAHIVLDGITPLKGNDKEAETMLSIFWEDFDAEVEPIEDAMVRFTTAIEKHWGIEIEVS